MLHRSCDRATIKENHSHDNVDAGLALYESSDCEVSMNVFEDNKSEEYFLVRCSRKTALAFNKKIAVLLVKCTSSVFVRGACNPI